MRALHAVQYSVSVCLTPDTVKHQPVEATSCRQAVEWLQEGKGGQADHQHHISIQSPEWLSQPSCRGLPTECTYSHQGNAPALYDPLM